MAFLRVGTANEIIILDLLTEHASLYSLIFFHIFYLDVFERVNYSVISNE